jgi:hypothetical protein
MIRALAIGLLLGLALGASTTVYTVNGKALTVNGHGLGSAATAYCGSALTGSFPTGTTWTQDNSTAFLGAVADGPGSSGAVCKDGAGNPVQCGASTQSQQTTLGAYAGFGANTLSKVAPNTGGVGVRISGWFKSTPGFGAQTFCIGTDFSTDVMVITTNETDWKFYQVVTTGGYTRIAFGHWADSVFGTSVGCADTDPRIGTARDFRVADVNVRTLDGGVSNTLPCTN